jgi:hypothetical protein
MAEESGSITVAGLISSLKVAKAAAGTGIETGTTATELIPIRSSPVPPMTCTGTTARPTRGAGCGY